MTVLTKEQLCKKVGWSVPEVFNFNTIEKCKEAVEALPNLEEGFVLYDEHGVPKCKIKSSLYLAIHRLRGECTPTPKRIMDLVFTNETDEYLTYFPEDEYLFLPYKEAYEELYCTYCEVESEHREVLGQKEFALKIKDYPFASLLFQKRKNKNLKFKEMFGKLHTKAKYRMTEAYLNEH